MVGPSIHGHGQSFGRNDDITLTKGLINSHSFGHPGCGRGVEENIIVKRIHFSHSKSLGMDRTFVVVTIDKELLGKE